VEEDATETSLGLKSAKPIFREENCYLQNQRNYRYEKLKIQLEISNFQKIRSNSIIFTNLTIIDI